MCARTTIVLNRSTQDWTFKYVQLLQSRLNLQYVYVHSDAMNCNIIQCALIKQEQMDGADQKWSYFDSRDDH